jgi:2-polyprenyl-3-methyl-5-hydroxy-6-metoxy-1,4-benzoquinol methylase
MRLSSTARLQHRGDSSEKSLPVSGDHPNALCLICASADTTVVISQGGRKLVKCRACSVAFLDPVPSEADLARKFTDQYITDIERLEGTFGKSRDTVLLRVAAEIQSRCRSGHILDVGCAGGHFLSKYFASQAWQRYGVEPSRFAAERAADSGVKILGGSVLGGDLPADFFDVITVIDVLYYFRQPQRELRALRSALKPTGRLFIELPLAETQLLRHTTKLGHLSGGTRSLLDSGHLYFLNPASIAHLLRETAFKIQAIVPLPGIQQRRAHQALLFKSFYLASRALWRASGGRWMFGPSFLVVAARA